MAEKNLGKVYVELEAQLEKLKADLAQARAVAEQAGASAGTAFAEGWRAKWQQASLDMQASMRNMDSDTKARAMSGEFDRIPSAADRANQSVEKLGASFRKIVGLSAGLFGIKVLFDSISSTVEKTATWLEEIATTNQRINSSIFQGARTHEEILHSIKGQKDAAYELSKAIENIEKKYDDMRKAEVEAGSQLDEALSRRNQRVNEATDALFKASSQKEIKESAAALKAREDRQREYDKRRLEQFREDERAKQEAIDDAEVYQAQRMVATWMAEKEAIKEAGELRLKYAMEYAKILQQASEGTARSVEAALGRLSDNTLVTTVESIRQSIETIAAANAGRGSEYSY